MWPGRVSNPGPLVYESDALPTALCGPAIGLIKILQELIESEPKAYPKQKSEQTSTIVMP